MALRASPQYTSTCSACKCVEGEPPCTICIFFRFRCRGTCRCCEDSRKVLPSTSRGLGPSSALKEDAGNICDQCNCLKSRKPCRKCVRGHYKCAGTCPCCSKLQEKANITIGEKDLDNIISSSLVTNMECKEQSVLLLPLETLNTGTSTQTVSPQQKVESRNPPARPASKSTTKKDRKILCTQCYCEADKIPCRICSFKNARCYGSCPCCSYKFKQRFLNPRRSQLFDPICPRCTRTPGEGICDYCRKVADESAAALDRCRPKRGRRSKPAILTHKKAKTTQTKDVEAKDDGAKRRDQPKDVEPPTEPKEKEKTKIVFVPNDLKLLDQSYVKDEYCLNCQCRRGEEPCNTCIESPCYGNCECCVEFNRQLLTDPVENLPENRESKEGQVQADNTGAVRKRNISSASERSQLVKTVDCQASTSGTQADHLYFETLKCEKCNCIKYCRPCEDCTDMDMGCTFPVDKKLCLSCFVRILS